MYIIILTRGSYTLYTYMYIYLQYICYFAHQLQIFRVRDRDSFLFHSRQVPEILLCPFTISLRSDLLPIDLYVRRRNRIVAVLFCSWATIGNPLQSQLKYANYLEINVDWLNRGRLNYHWLLVHPRKAFRIKERSTLKTFLSRTRDRQDKGRKSNYRTDRIGCGCYWVKWGGGIGKWLASDRLFDQT